MNERNWPPAVRLGFLAVVCTATALAQRFYPDDPLWKEPPPRSSDKIDRQQNIDLVDFYKNTIHKKGERNTPAHVYPSQGANTLGELPDSTWYTNRHDRNHRMTRQQLMRGQDVSGPPGAPPYTIVSVKAEGVSPGFTIQDAEGRTFFLKFDPPGDPEMATGAEVVVSKFYHAIGYFVPEYTIFYFRPEDLKIKPDLKFTDPYGRFRPLQPNDVDDLLNLVARDEKGRVRTSASIRLPGKGVGGFKYYKWRDDDPNEIAPHEHLRVLRGMYVFNAWLNHTDAKALNTYNNLVEENGRKFIRHYLMDFGSTLGSDALRRKDPRLGHEYMIEGKKGLVQLATLGAYVPKYARVDFPDDAAVGNFTADAFDPDKWKPNYPNAAFASRLPGDEYWGAKKVMAFTDDDIRAIVSTGQYTDPRAAEYISRVLIARRDAIGKAFFQKVLPLEDFRVENGELRFNDLAAMYNFRPAQTYTIEWSSFDNGRNAMGAAAGSGARLPAAVASASAGSYWAARIHGPEPGRSVTVYFRRDAGWKIVGIDREGENKWEPTE